MGNSESKNVHQQQFISEHPKFSQAKVISDNNNKTIQASFIVQNLEFDHWTKSLQSGSTKLTSDYLLLPEKTSFKHDQGLCGNTGTLTVDYPYYPYLLSELIKQRRPENKLFKESELWYVLYALVAAKHDLHDRSQKLGDIKPENIFVNQGGAVRIANVYSWPNQLPSFAKALDQERLGYNGLLAPEDIVQLKKGALHNDSNEQSEIFAIGATVLSAGILGDFSEVYNYQDKTFNFAAFKEKRRIWAEIPRYSEIFKSIILDLTAENPADRLTFDQLWQWVSQYQESVLQRKQFVLQSAPAKVEKTFQALKAKVY